MRPIMLIHPTCGCQLSPVLVWWVSEGLGKDLNGIQTNDEIVVECGVIEADDEIVIECAMCTATWTVRDLRETE